MMIVMIIILETTMTIHIKRYYHEPRTIKYKNLHPLHYILLPFRLAV